MTKIIVQTDDKKVAEFVEARKIPKGCSVLHLECSGVACSATACPMYGFEHTLIVEYIKPPRWRAGSSERYYYVNSLVEIADSKDSLNHFDNMRYEAGNYYQTAEEAEAAVERVRVAYRGDT